VAHVYIFAPPMRPKYSKILFIIMAVVLLGDLVFSYLQYNCSTIDGDMPFIVLGQDGYDKVLNDPLGLSTFQGETYPGTNRYASHKLMEVYFKTVPFFFQNFMSPIDSVYLSITLAKFVAHILLLLVLGYYVSVWFTWAKWKSYLTSSVIISSFLIGGNMYIDHLAIIDPAVTYIMFYALPMTALLAFYIPFYKYYITGAFPTSPLFAALWVVFALVMVFFGALTCAMLLVTLPMFAAGIMWRAYSNLPQDSKSLVGAVKKLNVTMIVVMAFSFLFALYSFYIGTKNSEHKEDIALKERFLFLFKGIKEVFFKNQWGVDYLLGATVISVVLLAVLYGREQKRYLYLVAGLAAFSALYLFLLPLGGYRNYRPLILRRDTTLPVLLVLMFVFTTSGMLLLKHYKGRFKVYPLVFIAAVCWHFESTDMEMPNGNAKHGEKELMKLAAASKEDCVLLDRWVPVASWWYNTKCEDSEPVANFLYFYHITPRKIYVHYKEVGQP